MRTELFILINDGAYIDDESEIYCSRSTEEVEDPTEKARSRKR